MSDTSIEWTQNPDGTPGKTWNPVRGCTRVSEGCRHCYAETFAARNLPEMRSPTTGKPFAVRTSGTARTAAGAVVRVRQEARWTGAVELIPSKLNEPLRWRKPQRVFVNSMSDLFHEALDFKDIAAVYGVMAHARHHTFQILTKRPARRLAFMRWMVELQGPDGVALPTLPVQGAEMAAGRHGVRFGARPLEPTPTWPLLNVWEGTSVEDQATADARIPLLLQTPAAVRFISLEPQIASVDVSPYVSLLPVLCCPRCGFRTNRIEHGPCPNDGQTLGPDVRLDWVIQGGESGPGARRFHVGWARTVRDKCRKARGGPVPYFLKQLGANVIDRNDAGFEAENETWAEGPQAGRPTDPSAWPTPHDGVEDNIDGYRDDYQGAQVRIHLRDRKGGDPSEWPVDLRVREFPRTAP